MTKSLSGLKLKTVILPLSLENNATLAGTGMILDTFGKKFQIPTTSCTENLPFDENSKSFSLKQATNHTEFILLMNQHKERESQYQSQLSFAEKDDNVTTAENVIDDDSSDGSGESDEDETEITSNLALRKETTAKKVQKAFQIQNQRFNRTFDSLQNKLWTAAQTP